MADATLLLRAIERGDPHAAGQLLPLVYEELRKLAAQRLVNEKSGQTLQATALVHEAYLRLVGTEQAQLWNSRGHFFAAAAQAMRRILIENARKKQSVKGGGNRQRIELSETSEAATMHDPLDLLALDEALTKLEQKDPRKAAVVKLRFFSGLSNQEAAAALGISSSTADNDWSYARAWLRVEMDGAAEEAEQ